MIWERPKKTTTRGQGAQNFLSHDDDDGISSFFGELVWGGRDRFSGKSLSVSADCFYVFSLLLFFRLHSWSHRSSAVFISVVLNKLRASSLTASDRPTAVSKKKDQKRRRGGKLRLTFSSPVPVLLFFFGRGLFWGTRKNKRVMTLFLEECSMSSYFFIRENKGPFFLFVFVARGSGW